MLRLNRGIDFFPSKEYNPIRIKKERKVLKTQMNIMVFDTETTSIDKPFCYNIGYQIVDTKSFKPILARDFVVEQVWHNPPLFYSAYYANKRPIYVQRMRSRSVKMNKFGYICRQMSHDIKRYGVTHAYAYNSAFDVRVFDFNCGWYKCKNPLDAVTVLDIRGFAHSFIVDNDYLQFCEEQSLFTESGNYSTTAEAVFRYVSGNLNFKEEHTALNDSVIETAILAEAVNRGAVLTTNYVARRSIVRTVKKTLLLTAPDGTEYEFDYEKIRINKEKTEITLR